MAAATLFDDPGAIPGAGHVASEGIREGRPAL